jgi:hypothetical protein
MNEYSAKHEDEVDDTGFPDMDNMFTADDID